MAYDKPLQQMFIEWLRAEEDKTTDLASLP